MSLEKDVQQLFASLIQVPAWAQLLASHGVTPATDLLAPVNVDRSVDGFADFSQPAAPLVAAGNPAGSLLYHCLASPAVRPPGLAAADYPTLQQIDLVENYVYSLHAMTEAQRSQLIPAVFAYEYREAAGTPHGQHADLVFSRTGIARVGNAPALWDAMRRCYAHAADAPHEVRVMPARYGVFLCERIDGDQMNGRRLGDAQFGDSDRNFLVPVAKLFSGQALGTTPYPRVELSAFHATDRLRRLFSIGDLPNPEDADLSRPPFVRTTRNGGLQIEQTDLGGSLQVASAAQALVREVMVSAGNSAGTVLRGVATVEPERLGVPAYNATRRYSTLRIGQNLFAAGFDYIGSKILGGKRLFQSPRNCSEFVNMRHRVATPTAPVEDLNLTLSYPDEFLETLKDGNYLMALYTDDICDGYIAAEFDAAVIGQDGKPVVRTFAAAPSFSVVTAPDFFPCIGSLDIAAFASNFSQGGPSPLCEGRLRANARMVDPDTGAPIFDSEDTIAAAVGGPARGAAAGPSTPVDVPTALTDGASNVFAPGWDVTYGRDGVFTSPYYHTAGLGSPFVEDAKLCAAANGMWAAASPDASRTFNRSGTPTATPLTDAELGFHPDHPAAQAGGDTYRGWDGEYGPFFAVQGGNLVVNQADIMRADYVSNALRNLMRFDKLRAISNAAMTTRLNAFKAAIEALDGPGAKVADTKRWLVAFQRVDDFGAFSFLGVMPAAAAGGFPTLQATATAWAGAAGFVFAFAQSTPDTPVPVPGAQRVIATLTDGINVVFWREADGTVASESISV